MSLSNLPPGVSDNDYMIAGADELAHNCDNCDADVDAYGRHGLFEYECPSCGYYGEFELEPPCRCGDYCRC